MVVDRDEQARHFIRICEYLARRFKRPEHFEDLRQEGLLAIYEILAVEPTAQDVKLFREARRRMHDYLNIDCLPMTIPVSDVARRLARDLDADLSKVNHSWSREAVEHLRNTLSAEQVSEDKVSTTQPSSERIYEDQEFNRELDKIIEQDLTSDDQMYIYMRFEEGMTLAEIADFFGLAGKTSAIEREKRLISKLQTLVSKIQQ